MGLSLYQVDAFTDEPFAGNPAAVCILAENVTDEWLQKVAQEMNLSETAFLLERDDGYNLRWFTPATEVDLCGHATLASAHVLWTENYLPEDQVAKFYTRSGLLTAEREADGLILLNLPVEEAFQTQPPQGLWAALGVEAGRVGKNRFDYLVEVDGEETVRNLEPDFAALSRLACEGVIVTSVSASKEYDFVSRFFAPRLGINEDPVTGSAHCCLAPYWKERLGKDHFVARQLSRRGGKLMVRLENERVYIGGQAVTVLKGKLY